MASRSNHNVNQSNTTIAPAWRQFQFFNSTSIKSINDSTFSPLIFRTPPLISTITSSTSSNLVLLSDLDGMIYVLQEDWETNRSWRAYGLDPDEGGREGEGRCTHLVIGEGRWKGVVLTLGEDSTSPYPILKVWDLGKSPSTSTPNSPPPILLRSSKIQYSTRPHPVSAMVVSPSFSNVVFGMADGTVVGFRGLDSLLENAGNTSIGASGTGVNGSSGSGSGNVLGLGKLRVLHEGNDPITGLEFRTSTPTSASNRNSSTTSSASSTLFILTTSHVLSYPISNTGNKVGSSSLKATIIDELGAGVGCSTIIETSSKEGGSKLIVAREEAIYVYGDEGRESCYAYEGPKSRIKSLSLQNSSTSSRPSSSYIAIVSPPLHPSISSQSATLRNYARNLPSPSSGTSTPNSTTSTSTSNESLIAKVTIFDLENKFIAHTGTFEDGVREIWEIWGSLWVLTEGGKLFRLMEQPLSSTLSTLFSRNLYTLAISLAQSRRLPPSEVAEIYRRYGDHLYSKGDFEGSMGCYLKTVGTVQASYVIRKFLDAQRLIHLTSYLQELHARGLANSDHTTLLLNGYTKLADDSALSSFIHSSSSTSSSSKTNEPPFELETAIRVCRQAGYFDYAVWLAEKYEDHQEYLKIQLEDRKDFKLALNYLRKLGNLVAMENLLRYGKTLLEVEPEETTKILVDLCCGTLEGERVKEDEAGAVVEVNGNGKKSNNEKGYMGYFIPSGPTTSTIIDSELNLHSSTPALTPLPRSAVANLRTASSLSESTINNRKSGIYSQYQVPESLPPITAVTEDLTSPRQFFAHYVDHPHEFITFLETIAKRRFGKDLDSLGGAGGKGGESFEGYEFPLEEAKSLEDVESDDDEELKDEQAVWNALLELYLSHWSTGEEGNTATSTTSHSRLYLQSKALLLLRSRDTIPYDETQALLICTSVGFTPGFTLLYERLGMYETIIRYWISHSTSTSSTSPSSTKVILALNRYGPSRPSLYQTVLRYLTSSSELLSKHQLDLIDILKVIEEEKIMTPIKVVQILSQAGEETASIGLVREYLKRILLSEKLEIESDQGLITSYRTESEKKRKEILELSDPKTPRIFQVTRCSTCGGQLDLPAVHFMCRHSYHQRCLPENESQCPSCARSQGLIKEIKKNNERVAARHDLFLGEVRESQDGYDEIAKAFGKGLMGFVVEDN